MCAGIGIGAGRQGRPLHRRLAPSRRRSAPLPVGAAIPMTVVPVVPVVPVALVPIAIATPIGWAIVVVVIAEAQADIGAVGIAGIVAVAGIGIAITRAAIVIAGVSITLLIVIGAVAV